MANTTNLNLVKLSGSEKMKTYPANQAGNMDTIDSAFGAGFGLSGKPNVNASINNLADGLAIVANGNTHAAITSGQYVYVRNHGSLSEGLYVATANIAANATLSGSNLTADSSGGLNALNSKFTRNSVVFTLTSGLFSSANSYAVIEKAGFCLAVIDATVGSSNIPAWTKIGTSPVDKIMDTMVTVYDASHATMTPCSYAAWDSNGISLPIQLTAGARYIIRVYGM